MSPPGHDICRQQTSWTDPDVLLNSFVSSGKDESTAYASAPAATSLRDHDAASASSPAEKIRLAADSGSDMIVCADIGEPPPGSPC